VENLIQAVSNPYRREILRLVWDRERSSGEIAACFDVAWPSISRNLKVLKQAGLVRERRLRNQRLYQADRDALRAVEPLLRQMWERNLDRVAMLAEGAERKRESKP
jgi:DNA-binding transcriptional ArsR family regulator